MTDEQFARAFERGEITPAAFDHRAHVRVAWVYVREGPTFEAATTRMREAIRRFAAAANAAQKYHETITVLWMRLLADAAAHVPPCELADLLQQRPELADKDLPLKYYSRERLFSDAARAGWVEPDQLPVLGVGSCDVGSYRGPGACGRPPADGWPCRCALAARRSALARARSRSSALRARISAMRCASGTSRRSATARLV